MSKPSVAVAVALSVAAGLLAGCQPQAVTDKTGGDTLVLRFATIDVLDNNGQNVAPDRFIKALARLSGGRVQVTLKTHYEDAAPGAEADLVTAIASGDLDGGWPGSRAFSRAGIHGLEPLEAPFMLTSYEAEKALATGPGISTLLGNLDVTGVVGLGLTVGPLRRPWSITEPLVNLRSWRGVTFRSFNSPVQEDTIRALGGVPVSASNGFPDLVRAGKLKAAETDMAQYARNGYGTLLPHVVANEVLWPRMMVLTMSRGRFESLTSEQRGWVQSAAKEAVQASVDFQYDDTAIARELCAQGARIVASTPVQLAELRRAVQPVLHALAADRVTAASFAEVKRVADRFPAPDLLEVPASCREP